MLRDMRSINKNTLYYSSITADELCIAAISDFKNKADHNKRESMACFVIAMLGTLGAPFFVTLGEELAKNLSLSPFFLSKLIPSFLSLSAAFCTAWLQLRKPQQLWNVYRTAQRQLEEHYRSYKFGLNGFAESVPPEKLLVEMVSTVYKDAHSSWAPLVPSHSNITVNKDSNG